MLGGREEEVHSDLDLNLLSVNKSLNGNQETVFLVAFVIIKDLTRQIQFFLLLTLTKL